MGKTAESGNTKWKSGKTEWQTGWEPGRGGWQDGDGDPHESNQRKATRWNGPVKERERRDHSLSTERSRGPGRRGRCSKLQFQRRYRIDDTHEGVLSPEPGSADGRCNGTKFNFKEWPATLACLIQKATAPPKKDESKGFG